MSSAFDFIWTSALVLLAVKMHSMLALHSDHSVQRALIIELAVRFMREVDLVDCVGIFKHIFITRRPLRVNSAQDHHQGWSSEKFNNYRQTVTDKSLKFHSPTIAQEAICTVNFILGLFKSVSELRLSTRSRCFSLRRFYLCAARTHSCMSRSLNYAL